MSEPTPTATPTPAEETEVVRLAKLVKLMRDTQKRFFAGDKGRTTVMLAKDYEHRVDKAVAWILKHRQEQGELFPANGQGSGPYQPGA